MEKIIRRMQKQDLDAVTEIWLESNKQAHDFVDPEYWEYNKNDVRGALSVAEVLVCEASGKIVGFLGMQGELLAGLFVAEAERGKGIGQALLSNCAKGKKRITLCVYQKNKRAYEFYCRAGFAVTAVQVDKETGEAEYCMEKQLLSRVVK